MLFIYHERREFVLGLLAFDAQCDDDEDDDCDDHCGGDADENVGDESVLLAVALPVAHRHALRQGVQLVALVVVLEVARK